MWTALRRTSITLMCLAAWLLLGGAIPENAQMQVYAQQTCTPPKADAGPDQSVQVDSAVLLDGSQSSQPSDCTGSLAFAWSFISKPSGSQASLSDSAVAKPTFVADVVGEFKLRLTVKNQAGSDANLVTITSTPKRSAVTVCPSGCDFAKIQLAIDAAPTGSTIEVSAGTYQENVAIRDKTDMTLRGAGRGLVSLDGSAGVGDRKPAILIERSQNVTIEGFTITDSFIGIGVFSSSTATIDQTTISRNTNTGLWVTSQARATIQDDTIRDNGFRGIDVSDTAAATIRQTTIAGSKEVAVVVRDNASAQLEQATISSNQDTGLWILGTAQVTIQNTTISNNSLPGVDAIDNSSVTIQESTISNSKKTGIIGRGSAKVTLDNNQITGNETGIQVFENSNATITGNTVSGNRGGNLCGMTSKFPAGFGGGK